MTLHERIAEDRRLVILRMLENSPSYTANESLIAIVLLDFGHGASRDTVRIDFAWLKEQGLLSIEEIATVQIATLTQRGVETAQGIVTTPGVKRPSPRL
jgi:hypothetical protein